MKKTLTTLIAAATMMTAAASPSILDIKHSITDNNVVPPESFETKTRELEENFYLRNYVVADKNDKGERLGSAKEYEKRLASLPTEIEMPYNDVVGRLINMYLGKRRGLVADMLALHSYYGPIFLEELLKEGMPTELQYLPVIESAINPNAVSRAGAAGLWQFMPGTAKGLGMEVNSLVDERRDARLSSRNAARYLHQLYDIYGDWSLAIAAYNCGPGNVNKALRRAGGGKKDFWEIYNYLPKETRGYVPAFIAANYVMNFYDKHNIRPTVVRRQLTTDTISVNKRIHFNQIADVLNIPVDEIRMLNPQFRKDIIPGNYRPYTLTLPKQQCLSYLMSEDAILSHDADLYARRTYVEPGGSSESAPEIIDEDGERNLAALGRQSANAEGNMELAMNDAADIKTITHVVGRGENIKDIAKKYSVSATDIKRWNHLRRGKVKEGDELRIETRRQGSPDRVKTVASTQPAGNLDNNRQTTQSDEPLPPAKKAKPEQPSVPEPRRNNTAANEDNSRAGRRYANNDNRADDNTVRKDRKDEKRATADNKAKNNGRNDRAAADNKSKDRTNSAASKNKKDNKTTASTQNTTKNKKQAKQPKQQSYTVKAGDNLEKIAKRNGTTVEELRRANNMKKGETMIKDGQNLKIPAKANANKKSGKDKNSSSKTGKNKKKR